MMDSTPAAGRGPDGTAPRRRTARSYRAIMDATAASLREVGYHQTTIEGVAARAGVGKATIYRWWPTKSALVIDALDDLGALPPLPHTGDLTTDLRTVLRTTTDLFTVSPLRTVLPALAIDVLGDSTHFEQLRRIIASSRAAISRTVDQAVAAGTFPSGTDTQLVLDLCAGTIMYRALIIGEPVDDHVHEQILALLLGEDPSHSAATDTKLSE